jgi:superfamily II DNA/RNA helicase
MPCRSLRRLKLSAHVRVSTSSSTRFPSRSLFVVVDDAAACCVSTPATQGLVIVPTRELGLQVYSVLKQLCGGSKPRITVMPVLDRSKNQRQIKWASSDPPHIIVANPT